MSEPPFRDVWARSSDGLRLHARSYGHSSAERPSIICLPGLTRHAGEFHNLALALTGPGNAPRHVLALDYRGRGRSDHDPDPGHYSVPVETSDALRMLDDQGIGRAIFVGSSRGGIITMAAASARPQLVIGAILNDIGPVIERAGLLRIKAYVGKLSPPRDLDEASGLLRNLFGIQFPTLAECDWRRWAANTWDEKDGGLVLAYDPALARTLDPIGPETEIADLWGLFEALKGVPVLVVRGENSDLLSADTVERMRQVHPEFEAASVPGQGHAPLLETPDVLGRIRRFVERAEARLAGQA